MQKTDHLALDGQLLRLFILIYDSGSVSRAAERLAINQSSASHGLQRLRDLVGDPLFVRAGRGITPTARADLLIAQARALLSGLERFAEPESYDPLEDEDPFVIAANDYEVETVLRPFFVLLRHEAPKLVLQILRAHQRRDWTGLLRDGGADLVLAPRLQSEESDLLQQTLFEDRHLCYFDPAQRPPPQDLAAYCAAPHAVMLPGPLQPTEIDRNLAARGRQRHIALAAPGFAMLAAMIRGSDIVATMPSRLGATVFTDFQAIEPPLKTEPFAIAQIWHSRYSASPRHRWFRRQLQRCVA